jgi:NAD-dependent SIR2 family protein deacetylase
MASTALNDEETKEYFDKENVLTEKIVKLAKMIKASKHFIAFTGAGISTSAGIPDFRSGKDTVLKTGAGVWTKRAAEKEGQKYKKGESIRNKLQALPTKSHMALVKLEQEGMLKHLISQNSDGLHRRSGFPYGRLSEVHGNTNLEYCRKCGKQYLRDFTCRVMWKSASHLTGRKCTKGKCKGLLVDSIINFGQSLPDKPLNDGFENSKKADLCLVLGSSCTVTPAADMPSNVGEKGENLVMVNLQTTPIDRYACMRINAKIDDVMVPLMKELGLDIPEFSLKRYITFRIVGPVSTGYYLQVQAIDSDETSYELFTKGTLTTSNETIVLPEPLQFPVKKVGLLRGAKIDLEFFGNYGEPNLQLTLGKILEPLFPGAGSRDKEIVRLAFEYDPKTRIWTTAGKSLDSLMIKKPVVLSEDEKKTE